MTPYSLGDNDPFKTVQPEVKASIDAEVPDIVPPTVAERLVAALERAYGPLSPVNGYTIRMSCRFCRGKGCFSCDTEAEREYRRQFPTGPQPLVTFHLNDPEEMALAKKTIGAEAVAKLPKEPHAMVQMLLFNLKEAAQEQQHLAEAYREEM